MDAAKANQVLAVAGRVERRAVNAMPSPSSTNVPVSPSGLLPDAHGFRRRVAASSLRGG